MKIVVLAGGQSDEHDVSMSSGSKIAAALRANGHQVILMDLSAGFSEPTFDEVYGKQAGQTYEAQIKTTFTKQKGPEIGANVIPICQSADLVFLGLHGGIGENGKLAALFDIFGIRYTGSGSTASALAMNKQLSKELFCFHGIQTADWQIVHAQDDLSEIPLPAVVKPLDNGSSIGVTLVDTRGELKKAVAVAASYSRKGAVLVEEKIVGREFSVGVLDEQALPVIEIRPKKGFYDYANKYQVGATEEITPAPIAARWRDTLQTLALKIHHDLGLEVYSRSDFLLTKAGTVYAIEVNSLPGMTPTSLVPQEAAAEGLSYGALCEKIVTLSLEKYGTR